MLDRDDLDGKLFDNYLHYYNGLDELDYSGDRPFLSWEDVLDAHYLICNHFLKLGEGIAGFGPKDFGLLSSAVSRQLTSAGGSFVYNDFWDIASSLIFGLINDHPFHDGNKRTAFLSSVFFMMQHNFTPAVDITEVEDFTVEIADFNRVNGRHMKIEEIAPKFKKMFRKQDNRISYVVTFNELQSLLSNHGCSIRNPQGNYIDVFVGEDRVSQIGFPGWSKEVSRNAISTVRKSTGLTSDKGVDAQVFFKGADPLSKLIGDYEEPLKRLAYRCPPPGPIPHPHLALLPPSTPPYPAPNPGQDSPRHAHDHRRSLRQNPANARHSTRIRHHRLGLHADIRPVPQGGHHLPRLRP